MSRLSLDALCDRIASTEAPLVLMHVRPDGDTVGSAAALMHIFRALGREPRCLCADPIPSRLAFLMKGLNAEFPKPDAAYTALSVDVASRGQLGNLADLLVGELAPAYMIDHHGRGEEFADCYRDPDASAAGEIVYAVALRMQERGMLGELSPALIDSLFAAISSDTGCFKFSNATEKTHLAAARLIALGANAAEINRKLFDTKSHGQVAAEGYIASHIRLHPSKRIASALLTRGTVAELGLRSEHFDTAIDIVRSLEGVEVAVLVKETDDGRYKISLRSVGLDVSAIAAAFGGGGHIRAAGCTLTADSAEAAEETILGCIADALGKI